MKGYYIGAGVGALLAITTVVAIPGEQGGLAFLIGFLFGLGGGIIGALIEHRREWF